MRMQQYGKGMYRTLAEGAGQAVDLSWTGALRLAHTAARDRAGMLHVSPCSTWEAATSCRRLARWHDPRVVPLNLCAGNS
jgi:hypothetical protein